MFSTFSKIRTILYKKFSFHYNQIQPETQLELELGMDSREMFDFLSELEKTFIIVINRDEVDYLVRENKVLRIQDIINYVEEKQKEV